MFKGIKRTSNYEMITSVKVKVDRSVYEISPFGKDDKGFYGILIKKNGKIYDERKRVGKSLKNLDKKIQEIVSFLNKPNYIKRLSSLVEEENELERNHKKAITKRETKIRNDRKKLETKKVVKVSPKVRETARKEIGNIMSSLSMIG